MTTMPPAPTSAEVIDWARELYVNAVDQKDAAGFAAPFADDAWMRFGNNEPIVGRENIEAAIAGFFSAFVDLRHQSVGAWYDDGALILEAVVTYTRFDGGVVSVPAVTIMRFADAGSRPAFPPVVQRCQMYVDLTPLFAPSAPTA